MHEIDRLIDVERRPVRRRRGLLPHQRAEPRDRGVASSAPGVPYRIVGGTKFYDRREIKDALAYLRALVNPDDEVGWKRIVNVPKRGVGDTSVRKVEAYAQGADVAFRDALREAAAAGVTGRGARRDQATCSSSWPSSRVGGRHGGVGRRARGDARPHRLPRRARGRAHDRGAGPDREPRRARRRRAGSSTSSARRRRPRRGSPASPASRQATEPPHGSARGCRRSSRRSRS